MHKIAQRIQKELIKLTNTESSRWWENYVKHGANSRGVSMSKVRNVIEREYGSTYKNSNKLKNEKIIVNDLMKQDFMDEKLAAILIVQKYWVPNKKYSVSDQLEIIENWFDQKYISDWNICDWLCVKVIHPIIDIKENQETTIEILKKWNKDPYLWKARASLVAFCMRKDIGDFEEQVFEFSEELIQREERFSKTAVGWAMRDFSEFDKQKVLDFLEKYKDFTTQEVVKNATKHHSKIKQQKRSKSVEGKSEKEQKLQKGRSKSVGGKGTKQKIEKKSKKSEKMQEEEEVKQNKNTTKKSQKISTSEKKNTKKESKLTKKVKSKNQEKHSDYEITDSETEESNKKEQENTKEIKGKTSRKSVKFNETIEESIKKKETKLSNLKQNKKSEEGESQTKKKRVSFKF